jgi:DNA-binding transcriptional MocR family regulator
LASTPPIRRRAFEALPHDTSITTRHVAMKLGLPTTTTRRALEELAAHGLAVRRKAEKQSRNDVLPKADETSSKGGQDLWRRLVAGIPEPPPAHRSRNISLSGEREI